MSATLILLGAFFCHLYISAGTSLPYYFSWDMDLLTAQDLLLLRSGHMPDHLVHPGQGMLVLLNIISSFQYFMDGISASNLEQLNDSLVPLIPFAEFTDFVRIISPVLMFGIVLTLYLTFQLLFQLGAKTSILIFLFLSTLLFTTQTGIYSRTEHYAVFYWVLSLFWAAVARAAWQESKRNTTLLGLIASGFFAGLSFITKVQSLILISLTLIFIFYFWLNDGETEADCESKMKTNLLLPDSTAFRRLAFANLLFFVIVSFFSFAVRIGDSIHHLRGGFGFTPWWSVALVLILGTWFIKTKLSKTNPSFPAWSRSIVLLLVPITTGILLSLLTHFFLYSDWVISLRHLLVTFKVVYLGFIGSSQLEVVQGSRRWSNYLTHSLLFSVFFITSIQLIRSLWTAKWQALNRHAQIKIVLIFIIFLFLVVNTLLVTRSLSQLDLIWAEVSFVFFGLLFTLIWFNKMSSRQRRWWGFFLVGLASVFIVKGLFTQIAISKAPPTGYYREKIFLKNAYGGNQEKVRAIMERRFDQRVNTTNLFLNTRNYKSIKQKWKEQIVNATRIARNMSFLQPGLAVTHDHLECRVKDINGLPWNTPTLDVSQSRFQSSWIWHYWAKYFGYIESLANYYPSSQTITVARRQDRRLYAFIPKEMYTMAVQAQKWPSHQPLPKTKVFLECAQKYSKSAIVELWGFDLFQNDQNDDFQSIQINPSPPNQPWFLAQVGAPID